MSSLKDLKLGDLFIHEGLYWRTFGLLDEKRRVVQKLASHEFTELPADCEVIGACTYIIMSTDSDGFTSIDTILIGCKNPRELFEQWWDENITKQIGAPPTGGDTERFVSWRAKKSTLLKQLMEGHQSFQNLIVRWLIKKHNFMVLPHEELHFSQGF